MEFKQEVFVDREIEIAGYLKQSVSLKHIEVRTGLNKKILAAHFRNMMEKRGAGNIYELIRLITL